MNTLRMGPGSAPPDVMRLTPPAVYVDGQRRRDLKALSCEIAAAPTFGRCVLQLDPASASGQAVRCDQVGLLPPVGSDVLIRFEAASGAGEFQGCVARHVINVSQDAERLAADVEHALASRLRAIVSRHWQHDGNGSAVGTLDATRISFNDANTALTSQVPLTVNGRETRVFDATISAQRWTVADALAYLLATAVPPEVHVQDLAELADLAGEIDLGSVDVTGLSVADALVRIAQVGGLSLRGAREGLGLVFYRPGLQGQLKTVQLQPAGDELSTAKSNLWRGQVKLARRPSRNGVVALGEQKHYEHTFMLAKGWDTSLETARWRDFVRSMSDDWPTVAAVYRKWVLNEHGWYCGAPWYLDVFDMSAVSAEDFQLSLPRKFLPCLSCDTNGQSLGYVVEISCSGGPWRRWNGPLWVSQSECAVYLGGDAMPGEFFQAAAADEARVRITATVAADARLNTKVKGEPNTGRQIIDLGARAAWRSVSSGSVFHNASGLGSPAVRNDETLLQEAALRHADVVSTATEAEFQLGWIDTTFHVGDIIERVDGRVLELASNVRTQPSVQAVRHNLATDQTTTLIVRG